MGKQIRWNKSNWIVLFERAVDFYGDTEVLEHNRRWAGALHSSHIALEILMKAAISKRGGKHPADHRLAVLSHTHVGGWSIASEIRLRPEMSASYSNIVSAWGMQDRYNKVRFTDDDIAWALISYKEVFRWVRTLID